jgi:hypothetical protein
MSLIYCSQQKLTESIVLEVRALRVINLDIHTLRARKKDTMGAVFAAVIKVDRMRTVKICPRWCAVGVSVPELFSSASYTPFKAHPDSQYAYSY